MLLKTSAKLAGKHLCWSLLFHKVADWRLCNFLKTDSDTVAFLCHSCFPVNFARFLRMHFSQNTSRQLLLHVQMTTSNQIVKLPFLHIKTIKKVNKLLTYPIFSFFVSNTFLLAISFYYYVYCHFSVVACF